MFCLIPDFSIKSQSSHTQIEIVIEIETKMERSQCNVRCAFDGCYMIKYHSVCRFRILSLHTTMLLEKENDLFFVSYV